MRMTSSILGKQWMHSECISAARSTSWPLRNEENFTWCFRSCARTFATCRCEVSWTASCLRRPRCSLQVCDLSSQSDLVAHRGGAGGCPRTWPALQMPRGWSRSTYPWRPYNGTMWSLGPGCGCWRYFHHLTPLEELLCCLNHLYSSLFFVNRNKDLVIPM